MPLGDSITWGFQFNETPTGGYRSRLYTQLANAGYEPHYVGSVVDTFSQTLRDAGETHHEGHNGYRIDQLDSNLDAFGGQTGASSNNGGFWLTGTGDRGAVIPKYVLLHAGTNDILKNFGTDPDRMAARMNKLVGRLTDLRPDAHLLVSSIIPIGLDKEMNDLVREFNERIEEIIVPQYRAQGRNVHFVDQYGNFADAQGNYLAGSLPDGKHPDGTGYGKMAATWFRAIDEIEQQLGPVADVDTASAVAGASYVSSATLPEPAALPLLLLAPVLLLRRHRRGRARNGFPTR